MLMQSSKVIRIKYKYGIVQNAYENPHRADKHKLTACVSGCNIFFSNVAMFVPH